MVDGQPRFRTLSAATIGDVRRQRELLQSVAAVRPAAISRRRSQRASGARPIDAKATERSASIVAAKQKGDEPPLSHASVTDVALSPFPQKATVGVGALAQLAREGFLYSDRRSGR
jgi:hypothetical protein